MTLAAAKDDLRQRMRATRASLSPKERDEAAVRLRDHLLHHPLVRDLPPGPVLVPVGHRSEIGTDPLAAALEAKGWTIVRPRSDPARTHLDAVPWPLDRALTPGFAGIPEPPQDAPVIGPRDLRLILVPAVAFARDGHRIGSGLGFFDRFLRPLAEHRPRPVTLGIGYAFQLVPSIPSEPHDVPLDGFQLEEHPVVCRSV